MRTILKRFLTVCLLLGNAFACFGYGHLGNLYNQRNKERYLPNKKYLSYKFIYEDDVSFCTEESSSRRNKFVSHEVLAQYFKIAFWEWTRGTAEYLQNSGREEEFADIISVLKKPFKLTYLGPCREDAKEKADIEIRSNHCHKIKVSAYYSQYYSPFHNNSSICFIKHDFDRYKKYVKKLPIDKAFTSVAQRVRMDLPIEKELLGVSDYSFRNTLFVRMLHEMGHAFGLADEEASLTMRAEQRFNLGIVNTSKQPEGIFGAEAFSTPYTGYGIMSSVYEMQRTADDVMGIITIFDRLMDKERIIYPLLSDYKKPLVGAIVNGNYVFPPLKKHARAKDWYWRYFSRRPFSFWTLERYGDDVFEREFDPVTLRSLKEIQNQQQQEIIYSLQENL